MAPTRFSDVLKTRTSFRYLTGDSYSSFVRPSGPGEIIGEGLATRGAGDLSL
jgi:hypothetical protein